MRRFTTMLAVGCLVASGLFGCGDAEETPEQQQQQDDEKGTLEGDVLSTGDPDGDGPLEDASVSVAGETDETDEDGEFSFELDAGDYTVEASLEGYITAQKDVEVEEDETTTVSVELTWDPGCDSGEEAMEIDGEVDCYTPCETFEDEVCSSDEYCDEEEEACLEDDCDPGQQARNLGDGAECFDVCDDHDDCDALYHCWDVGLCRSGCGPDRTEHTYDGDTECRDECDDSDDCDDGYLCHDADGVCLEDPDYSPPLFGDDDYPPEDCLVSPRPDRCDEDPDSFDFEPASYVDFLEIADEDCCVDLTDDNEADNSVAELLDLAGDFGSGMERDDINADIAQAIDDDEIILIFEHDGLDEVEDDEEFDATNILYGDSFDSDDEVVIDDTSFEEGAHPLSLLPDGLIEDNGDKEMTAGPGKFVLPPEITSAILLGMEFEETLQLDYVTVSATPVASSAEIEDGVILDDGELGGIILVEDVRNVLNASAEDCDCLDNPEPMIESSNGDYTCELDDADGKASDCENQGEQLCSQLANVCGMFSMLIGLVADIDATDQDGEDALSFGMEFEAAAVTIVDVTGN